jgi:hypothetical protein
VEIGNSKVTHKGKNRKATKLAKITIVASTSSVENKEKTTMEKTQPDPKAYGSLIGRKSRSETLPFLLTFEIFNQNVHNFLVDSNASSDVMPYLVCKKLNVKPEMIKNKIAQLDSSHEKVLGELKDVMIHLASNSKVHQMIDIIIVDIPKAYSIILRREWSAKINRYFIMEWSHLWLPHKGRTIMLNEAHGN